MLSRASTSITENEDRTIQENRRGSASSPRSSGRHGIDQIAGINRRSAAGWGSGWLAVEYDRFGETVLTGVLKAGQIGAGDAISVPTANGTHSGLLASHPLGGTLEEFLSPGEGYVTLHCPECDSEYEVDGFTDPLRAPCDPPPGPSLAPRARPEWARVLIDLLPGFDAAARAVGTHPCSA